MALSKGGSVDGLDNVLSNLNKEIAALKGRSRKGLFEAGLQVQRVAQQELRKSIVTGNLRASAYTRARGNFTRLDDNKIDRSQVNPDPKGNLEEGAVEIGFTAVYAVFVHENMEGGRSPKFLEAPLRRNQQQILDIIKRASEA